MVAPDHLFFQGLTKRLVTVTFRLLAVSQRERVGASLRDALTRSHIPSTTIHDKKRKSIVSVGISEWAATLTVFAVVMRCTLRSARWTPGGMDTPLRAALKVIDAYTSLECAAYIYPRAELDGLSACASRAMATDLQRMAESFFELVRGACLRADLSVFGLYLDVPNHHRLRELVDHVTPALLHVRQAQEQIFETSHQPLKCAVLTGNGRQDAQRALTRYVESELASRIILEAGRFSISNEWLLHAETRACIVRARPLFSGGWVAAWRCSGRLVEETCLPQEAREHGLARCDRRVTWRRRATRGDNDCIEVGDAVFAVVGSFLGASAVNIARTSGSDDVSGGQAFFLTVPVFTTRAGNADAVDIPFLRDAGTACVKVQEDRYV